MNLDSNETKAEQLNKIYQLVQELEAPLDNLMEESFRINTNASADRGDNDSGDIIFSNSKEIKSLIDQVINQIESNKKYEPVIFDIFESNEYVQSVCKEEINPGKISKQDIAWLLSLEKEVYKNIERWEIHLSDLSYNLAVSKRQLNRKIRNLIHLTPNKYIRILKLHKAKRLIDDFRYDTISQISYAVGYHDTHYFSKLFATQYEVTPRELLDSKR